METLSMIVNALVVVVDLVVIATILWRWNR